MSGPGGTTWHHSRTGFSEGRVRIFVASRCQFHALTPFPSRRKIMRLLLAAPFLLLGLSASATHAERERYKMEKTENGYVRMDTATGTMSLCTQEQGQLVCRMAADDRSALEKEIDDLRGQMRALDGRIVKLEGSLSARLEDTLPSQQDFDKSLGYMEQFFRRFMDVMKGLDDNGSKPGTPSPQPGKA
jgi:hypothetical protein